MDEYVSDKKIIYKHQTKEDFSLFNYHDPYSRIFKEESQATVLFFSKTKQDKEFKGSWLDHGIGYINNNSESVKILDSHMVLKGDHNRLNLLCAGSVLYLYGLKPDEITEGLKRFPGIEHRMECFFIKNGVKYYND